MELINKYKVTLIGILIGAIGGYAYYYFVGCSSGTCAITTSPINSSLYGAMMGALLANTFKKDDSKTNTNENIIVANLKCSGCANTITKELLKLTGMSAVKVDNDKDQVTVSFEGLERNVITEKLHSLGYPEATEENGLLLQLKSFSSCMIGRINNSLN